MSLASLEDFVQLPNFFYRTIGIEPYERPSGCGGVVKRKSLLVDFIFYFGLINMNLMVLAEILYVLLAISDGRNFVEATITLSYIGFVALGEFKMLFLWWKKRALSDFVRDLQHIFPKTAAEQSRYKLRRYLRQCSRVTVGFSVLYMLLICTYNFFAVLQYLIYERWLQMRLVGQTLPYFMYIPWNWQDNWTYYPLYAASCLAGYTSAVGQISCDLLLCAAATQVIMHYDHVARSIRGYVVKAKGGRSGWGSGGVDCQQDVNYLNDIIAYHENILSLSASMNDVFGVPLFFNFMTSSFVICFVGFQMTIGVTTDTLVKLFLFLFSSTAQVYLICHYGQLLIDASLNISHAVYSQDWSEADVRYKKMLVLVAARAQKPACLKATSFLKVSRGTMTEIMQVSYKFFALLRTMYAK